MACPSIPRNGRRISCAGRNVSAIDWRCVSAHHNALDAGRSVLFEGAQGTMLDIDLVRIRSYIFECDFRRRLARARRGPHANQRCGWSHEGLHDARGQRPIPDGDARISRPRKCATAEKNSGAVTGRPGGAAGWIWQSCNTRSASMESHQLVVTKLDVFDTQKEIQVCIGYRYKGSLLGNAACGRGSRRSCSEYRALRVGSRIPTEYRTREAAAPGCGLPEISYLIF